MEDEADPKVLNLINEMMLLKRPMGSFGAYTISTLLTLLSLKDFQTRFPALLKNEISDAMIKGFDYVELNYFNPEVPY